VVQKNLQEDDWGGLLAKGGAGIFEWAGQTSCNTAIL